MAPHLLSVFLAVKAQKRPPEGAVGRCPARYALDSGQETPVGCRWKLTGWAIVRIKAGDNVGVGMIRDLRGVIEREGAGIGVLLTLAEPTRPMVTEAAGAGQFEMPGFAPVPRIQIVTVAQAMALRDRAVRLPARRDDGFKRAAREEDGSKQGALDLEAVRCVQARTLREP